MRSVRALAALALILAAPLHGAAAPFAVQVGDARLALDAPAGFADTSFTGSPRLQELAEALTSASNRVLLFALSDGDLRRFTLGDPLELRRYMIVVTSRAMEQQRMTEAGFRSLAADLERELKQAPPPGDFQKYLESQPPGEVSVLAALRRDPDAVAVLQGTRTKPAGFFERSKFLLSSTSLVLLRGKAVSLSVFTQYDGPADLEWLRTVTARWIDDLKRLNSR